jgi:hypothetical protein
MSSLLAELGAFYSRVAPLVGVLVGFVLAQGVESLRGRHRRRAHWGALRAEIDFCRAARRDVQRRGRRRASVPAADNRVFLFSPGAPW